MDEEAEDHRVLVELLDATMKISKVSITSKLAWLWRILRVYLLKPEVLLAGAVIVVFLIYLQLTDSWSRSVWAKLQASLLRRGTGAPKLTLLGSPAERESWEVCKRTSAVYAVQGRRANMEDRFVIDENVNNSTGISFFAVFDGHGGEFAAEFAKNTLVPNLYSKIIDISNIINGRPVKETAPDAETDCDTNASGSNNNDPVRGGGQQDGKDKSPAWTQDKTPALRRKSLKKSLSKTEDYLEERSEGNKISDPEILNKINNKPFSIQDFFQPSKNSNAKPMPKPKVYEAKCYVERGEINFGRLITDEVLAADYQLIETAKRRTNIAGTTALMAVIYRTKLVVANVGDSRGVMADSKGTAIPLSFDHKPQQVREHKRIHDAGGFIAFKGVWRVAGILATSRALGDYPLKDKNLVIATPDVLTFDLKDHKPLFLILASDGLWDTFTNEEAVAFIKDRLNEQHFGAKSLALQSYARGSVDNITVMVIVFKDGNYFIGSSNA